MHAAPQKSRLFRAGEDAVQWGGEEHRLAPDRVGSGSPLPLTSSLFLGKSFSKHVPLWNIGITISLSALPTFYDCYGD